MRRDELLLFSHRAQKAQRVRAEAQQPDRGERQQAQHPAARHRQPLAGTAWREHEERQHHAGGDLDRDARHHDARRGPEAGAGSRREHQRGGEQKKDQRVVVRSPDGQLEQHGVQPHKGCGPAARVTTPAGRPRDQRHRANARDDRDRLEGPQATRESQGRGRVARERE